MTRRVAIIGDGRMGRALAELAPAHGFEVAAFLGSAAVRSRGVTPELLGTADVAVEFTTAQAAAANIRGCAAAGVPVVSGTTGWEADRATLEDEIRAQGGGLLWSPNFAIGVHIFMKLAAEAARQVKAAGGFDAHLTETHHAAKKDAPSGTARRIQEIAGTHLGALGVTSVRTGHVPGTHVLSFDAPFEHLELVHEARDRRVFADGALVAAKWMIGKRGVFTLDDVMR